MHDKNFTNDYWVTMVYVDSYEDNVMRGWFSNPYLKEPEKFSSLSDFIIKMECMLDLMGLPQSYSANRSFRKDNPSALTSPCAGISRGTKATFCLTIRFRRNSSWQGTISWLESSNKQNFRSVLELITLMDSALREQSFPSSGRNTAALA